jgi:non-ribosomal peptide synthetase component E (peptide arylation enzyme)
MDPKVFCEWVERERVTHSMNIGPALAQMLDYPDASHHDLSSVTLLTSFNRCDLRERHLNVPCANLVGITEGVLMVSAPDAPREARHETVGHPVSNLDEIRLLEPATEREVPFGAPGELCFVGHRRPAAISACRTSTAPASPPTASSGPATSCAPSASAATPAIRSKAG